MCADEGARWRAQAQAFVRALEPAARLRVDGDRQEMRHAGL
jgi:hypothetical protein